jgi:hypothetical protein
MQNKKSGNAELKTFAGNARKRGQQNVRKVLIWVFKWGFVNESVLQKLLGVKRKPGVDLVKKGVLQKVNLVGHRLPHVYVISPAYMPEARALWENEMNFDGMGLLDNLGIPSPKTEIAVSQVHHQVTCQLAALKIQVPLSHLLSAREIVSGYAERPASIPDFATFRLNPDKEAKNWYIRTWFEIELNGKYDERLFNQLQTRQTEIEEENIDEVVFLCATEGIAKNIEQALKKENLPKVRKNEIHKLVKTGDWWKPAVLREKTEILILRDVLNDEDEDEEEE